MARNLHLALLAAIGVVLTSSVSHGLAAAAEDPTKGIHVTARVTTAAIMRTNLTYDVTVFLRLTYVHAGLPTKVEVVRSSKIPLVDECAVYNGQKFWWLDKSQPVPTVRVAPMRFLRAHRPS